MRAFSPTPVRALTLVGAIALLVASPLAAGTAMAAPVGSGMRQVDALSIPTETTVLADAAPVFVNIAVPAGLTPSQVTGTLAPLLSAASAGGDSGAIADVGTVTVTVRGQVRQSIQPTGTSGLAVALTGADLIDGQVSIGLAYSTRQAGSSAAACSAPSNASVSLTDVSLDVAGQATAPTAVADFFSPALSSVSVVIPDAPSRALEQAGLAAVGALAHGLPASVALSLTTSADMASAVDVDAARGRVVILDASGDAVSTSISTNASGVPTLTISGPEAQLSAAGAALGSDYLKLAARSGTTGLSQTGTVAAGPVQSLQQLGAPSQIALAGLGQTSSFVNVDQSAFGGPVSAASLHLAGMHSDIPDSVIATMNVYWNDFLIGSKVLGHDTAVDLTLPVDGTLLTASNGLRVTLSATPTSGNCTGAASIIPVQLFIDAKASTVTATRGQTLDPGFQRFPQVLGGQLPIAFGDGVTPAAGVASAGDLVVSLQRTSGIQLAVSVVSVGDFATSDASGLVVGATSDDSNTLAAPLRLDMFKAIDSKAVRFGVGTTEPYAALEGFESRGRSVLMLGGWSPSGTTDESAPLQQQAADYAVTNPSSWFGLSGDVLVAQSTGTDPVMLSSNAVVPQAAVTGDYRGYAIWIVVVVVALVVAGVIGEVTRRRRRSKLAKYVDAQERADRDALERKGGRVPAGGGAAGSASAGPAAAGSTVTSATDGGPVGDGPVGGRETSPTE